MWDCFHKTIADGVYLFVPVKSTSAVGNRKQWMTRELKNLVKKKTKAWNTSVCVESFSNWASYDKIHNSVKDAVKIAKINIDYKLVHDMGDNPNDLWKYVRSTQKTKENVADLRTCKKVIYAKTSVSKANILSSFFGIFTEENLNAIPNPKICFIQSGLSDISITPEIKKVVKLKENWACGPDLIHPKIIIELQAELVLPLVDACNQSLLDGRLPLVWKSSIQQCYQLLSCHICL